MSTDELFKEAAILVQNLTTTPNTNELLKLYGLYKQSKVGNIKEDSSNFLDVKEKMKAEYWEKEKGKDSESAMTEYTEYVVRLIQKYKS